VLTSLEPLRRGYDALLVLGDLLGRPLPAVLDRRPRAERRTIVFEHKGRGYAGDLYRPEGRAKAGVVFVPGAAELGKDDPRVVALAASLARARFAVLVPDVVALRQLRLLPESALDIGDALAWMLSEAGLTPQGRLGLVTTSVAIGPAVLALLDPPLSADVDFVVSIGGYHALPRTLVYLTTGFYEAHGVSLRLPPKEYGKWVYALSNAVRIDSPEERAAFEAVAWRKFRDPDADVTAELARSGPVARKIYAFVANRDPARSETLLANLPEVLLADIDALDLSAKDLGGIAARFVLVHGIDDDMIPYGESLSLAAALRPGQAKVFLLEGFHHVDIAPQFADGYRMWRAVETLLRERSRRPRRQ
jgi:fermentation-respiration switch protein FrsA (DUF1100 family)